MEIKLSLSDIITVVCTLVGLVGGYVILKFRTKNKNVIEGNSVKGNLVGGSRIKNTNDDISKKINSSNKNVIKNNTIVGDLIGGDDLS